MGEFVWRVVAPLSLCILAACGGKKVEEGDILEVTTDLREEATIQAQSGDAYSDGFTVVLPRGSQVRVVSDPLAGVEFIDVVAYEVDGVRGEEAVEEMLVTPETRAAPGYMGYYVTLPGGYLGTKLKKVSD